MIFKIKLNPIIILMILIVGTGLNSNAQQQGQYSQYMMNYFLINPGVAGTEDFVDVKLGYRSQWAGLEGSPKNYYFSVNAPLDKEHTKRKPGKKGNPHHSIGAMFSGQKLAVLSHNSAYVAYSYHLPVGMKATLSMGAMAGFNQFAIDESQINWGDGVSDAAVIGKSKTNFDLAVGFWFYTSDFFAGLSSTQIGQNKVDFSNTVSGANALSRHYYFTTGYKFKLNKDLLLIPSILLKGTPIAMQMDINSKVRYKNRVWAGASYRYQDAIVMLAGVSVPLTDRRHNQRHGNNVMLDLGYSYDLTTSQISKYSGGSHEIILALRIPTFGRIISPQEFW